MHPLLPAPPPPPPPPMTPLLVTFMAYCAWSAGPPAVPDICRYVQEPLYRYDPATYQPCPPLPTMYPLLTRLMTEPAGHPTPVVSAGVLVEVEPTTTPALMVRFTVFAVVGEPAATKIL